MIEVDPLAKSLDVASAVLSADTACELRLGSRGRQDESRRCSDDERPVHMFDFPRTARLDEMCLEYG